MADNNDTITEKELHDLASNIPGSHYFKVGYELGFSYATIENTYRERRSYSESMHELLVRWKTKEINVNTREELTQLLRNAGLDQDGNMLLCVQNLSWLVGRSVAAGIVGVVVIGIILYVLLQPKVTGCASDPCLNGGICKDYTGGTYSCTCINRFTGKTCEEEYVCFTEYFTLRMLQRRLRTIYNVKLCRITLTPNQYDYVQMDKLFTTVSLYKLDRANDTFQPAIESHLNGSINDVFQTYVEGTLPPRIVLVGEAGRGKTTAVAKMAYDWANKASDSPLKDVPLLFVLKMRYMDKTSSLIDEIVKQFDIDAKCTSELDSYIHSNQRDVTILFDGYDEFSGNVSDKNTSNDLLKTLRFERCTECRVLVTTRPFRENDFAYPNSVYSKFKLKGYSHEQAMDFIDIFFGNSTQQKEHADELKRYLKDKPLMEEMITTPLFCTMVCRMWSNGPLMNGTYTRTTFFDEIMNYLWKHAHDRATTTRHIVNLKDLVLHIGEVAFNKLLDGREKDLLLFTDHDFNNINATYKNLSFEIGLLTETTTKLYDDKKVSIEFFHKLAQEYSAGKYLANLHKENRDILSKIKSSIYSHWEEVLKFAVGTSDLLCEDILGKVFLHDEKNNFVHFPLWNPPFNDMLLNLISETDKCAGKIESNLTSVFQEGGILYVENFTMHNVIGFEKLSRNVKTEITELHISDELSEDVLERLWKNLQLCTKLRKLRIASPFSRKKNLQPLLTVKHFTTTIYGLANFGIFSLLPNIEELLDLSIFRIPADNFTRFWNTISSLHLSRLKLNIPPITPSELNPLLSVRVFETSIELSSLDIVRILPKLPNITDLTILPYGQLGIRNNIIFRTSHDEFGNLWNNLSALSHLNRLSLNVPRYLPSKLKKLLSVTTFVATMPPYLEPDYFRILLDLLANLPNIDGLCIRTPDMLAVPAPTEESRNHFSQTLREMDKDKDNLLNLMLRLPEIVPGESEPFTESQALQTTPTSEQERYPFSNTSHSFPAVKIMEVEIAHCCREEINAQFHDIFLSAFLDNVMEERLSLTIINITFSFRGYHGETISHDSVTKLINMLKSSPAIENVNIMIPYPQPCLFNDSDLVDIVKAVRSIPSLIQLGIPCAIDKSKLELYASQSSEHPQMEIGEQMKSFIKLTLHGWMDHGNRSRPTAFNDVWFLSRLIE